MAGARTAVIGAGTAGLCAADGLRSAGPETVVHDGRRSWGGHTSSDRFAGHWFDEARAAHPSSRDAAAASSPRWEAP